MLPILVWVPVGTSIILGVVFLSFGEVSPAVKIVGVVVFAIAVFLQFFSAHPTVGLVLQVGVALSLALWRRWTTSA